MAQRYLRVRVRAGAGATLNPEIGPFASQSGESQSPLSLRLNLGPGMMRGSAGRKAVGQAGQRDPVHLALNLPESVSKAVRPAAGHRCSARGFHGSKDKVLLVFRLLLKKPTHRRSQRGSKRVRRGTIIISSSPLVGRLLSRRRRRRRRNGPPFPLLSPSPLSSRLSRQCKVIAVTRAATVIRARAS